MKGTVSHGGTIVVGPGQGTNDGTAGGGNGQGTTSHGAAGDGACRGTVGMANVILILSVELVVMVVGVDSGRVVLFDFWHGDSLCDSGLYGGSLYGPGLCGPG